MNNNEKPASLTDTEIVEIKNPFKSEFRVYNPPYPSDIQKVALVSPCKKCMLQWFGGIIIWILILAVFGGIVTAGVYVIYAGINRRDYGDSFDITGECKVVSAECVNAQDLNAQVMITRSKYMIYIHVVMLKMCIVNILMMKVILLE